MLNKQRRHHMIRFTNINREIEAPEGDTLLQSARRAGIRIVGACGGKGICGSCAVKIVSGSVENKLQDSLDDQDQLPGQEWVRACLAQPNTDCVVEIAPRALAAVARTEPTGIEANTALHVKPVIQCHDVKLIQPSLEDSTADLERVLRSLDDASVQVDHMGLRRLPLLLRENNWQLRLVMRNGELIGGSKPGQATLGLAIDFGSTNIAAFLLNLESGELLASLGLENPQTEFGADIITRINHAVHTTNGSNELQAAAVAAIATFVNDICSEVSAEADSIADIAVCGNTVMNHLLLGLPVSQLGLAPFVPATSAAMDIKARDLGLSSLQGSYIHVMPNIGGFIGGDHVAALVATEELWSDKTCILVDIGTNTEISLIHNGEIFSASTASGPALEGGNISAGMRAAEGAIERVRLNDDVITVQVIGNATPVGLCGSGVIDTLAVLFRSGIINKRGQMLPDHPLVRKQEGGFEVAIAPNISFTQKDVRTVQLAKAAIRAGIDLLLREAGLNEKDIDTVIIAGAFGAYIDIANAVTIGMFPDLEQERFKQVGNAAGIGIQMVLVSSDVRKHAQNIAKRCRHTELSLLPGFQKTFIGRIGF